MKNPLLLDEADKRGEQHFYRRSSSCRKSFITFRDCRIEKEKNEAFDMYNSPFNNFYYLDNIHQKLILYNEIIFVKKPLRIV